MSPRATKDVESRGRWTRGRSLLGQGPPGGKPCRRRVPSASRCSAVFARGRLPGGCLLAERRPGHPSARLFLTFPQVLSEGFGLTGLAVCLRGLTPFREARAARGRVPGIVLGHGGQNWAGNGARSRRGPEKSQTLPGSEDPPTHAEVAGLRLEHYLCICGLGRHHGIGRRLAGAWLRRRPLGGHHRP